MNRMFLLFTLLILAGFVKAQDCTIYFPSSEGSELTYTWYSKPGKAESSSKMTVVKKNETGGKLKLDIAAENFDAKGNPQLKFNYAVWCDGENFFIDMRSALGSMNLTELEGFKIETTDMQFPSNLTAGQQLNDASIQLSLEGPVPMNMVTNITNRKVENQEQLSTPAGTFNCFKISYDMFSKVSIVKTEGKVLEWYAPNIGLVRSETYNKKNKLVGINELTGLK